jgi:L-histidine Nalpha-methyltransferase
MSTPRSAALAVDPAAAAADAFARDVRAGLLATPKRLPSRWFYDALGSSLFEAICRLPWYRITRAEAALLARHAAAIAGHDGGAHALIELGSGSGEKLALVLDGFVGAGASPAVHLVDISRRALELSARTLDRFPHLRMRVHEAPYLDGLRRATSVTPDGRRLVLFLGSNLGNFDPADAAVFLREIAGLLAPGDGLLLGLDLVKPAEALLAAYDDPLGVTAAFNKNVLQRMNAELGATIRLDTFAHEARWHAAARRVEMHLVSRTDQAVDIPRAGISAVFRAGESIWTESSYKYDPADIEALGAVAGFTPLLGWTDEEAGFALTLFERQRPPSR